MTLTAEQLSPLAVGTPAPDFNLPAAPGGKQIALADFRGKNLIIVFYPKDQTPGCTRQLCALRDDRALFSGLNTEIIASNPDSEASHQRFIDKEGYNFPILVDADRTMARNYHALKEDGKGVQRTVYIIDPEGVIRFAEQGMPTDEDLAAAIRGWQP